MNANTTVHTETRIVTVFIACSHTPSFTARTTNAQSGAKIRLVVLDPGLVCHLSPRNRENFLALFGALVQGDGYLAGSLIIERARIQDCEDPEAFKHDIENLVNDIPLLKIGAASIGKLMRQVLDIARSHRV
jgi:aarF domain-containing kinase